MRILIQRVRRAQVGIGGRVRSSIGPGLLVLVGIGPDDGEDDVRYLCEKLAKLRIFDDEAGVMNRSVVDAGAMCWLSVSSHCMPRRARATVPLTSGGRARGGRAALRAFRRRDGELLGRPVRTGVFGADMQVELVNDGPVTIWIDSKQKEY
ncbi:MAG: D-aminoacyl-tRNA deacylase [Alistipes sp.]